jgi:hypothetical protein
MVYPKLRHTGCRCILHVEASRTEMIPETGSVCQYQDRFNLPSLNILLHRNLNILLPLFFGDNYLFLSITHTKPTPGITNSSDCSSCRLNMVLLQRILESDSLFRWVQQIMQSRDGKGTRFIRYHLPMLGILDGF